MIETLLGLFVLWLLGHKSAAAPAGFASPVTYHPPHHPKPPTVVPVAVPHPVAIPVAVHPTAASPAWPAAVPSGLPAFPGPGWVLDAPPSTAVSQRALALLPQLWAHGEGTAATEQVAQQWRTFQARMMGGKRSVLAYRLAAAPAPVTAVPGTQAIHVPPGAQGPGSPAQTIHVPAASPAAAAPAPAAVLVTNHAAAPAAAPTPTGLPTLRLTHPNTVGPSVIYLQQKLGIKADGVFGSGTQAAVMRFQQAHGLQVDGVVGTNTWRALG